MLAEGRLTYHWLPSQQPMIKIKPSVLSVSQAQRAVNIIIRENSCDFVAISPVYRPPRLRAPGAVLPPVQEAHTPFLLPFEIHSESFISGLIRAENIFLMRFILIIPRDTDSPATGTLQPLR